MSNEYTISVISVNRNRNDEHRICELEIETKKIMRRIKEVRRGEVMQVVELIAANYYVC